MVPFHEIMHSLIKPELHRFAGASYLLAAAVCAILWLGLFVLFLACAKYPPYHSDMVVGPEPGSYDAFLENRRIAEKLKTPFESGAFKLSLVVAGAWAAFCGWTLRKGAGKEFYLSRGLIGVGCATVAMGLLVFPVIVARGTSSRYPCIDALRQIDGAKEYWAMENKKTATDIPTWRDLVGRDKYMRSMPECPGGGRFTINNMATAPRCSIPGHTLQ